MYRYQAMAIRHLINEDGAPFDDGELDALGGQLDALTEKDRKDFRNANAESIAQHKADQILIVAGPGTGKSTLFKQRILFWLKQTPSARILALSFVRKLVADLNADIQNDTGLSDDQKKQADVFTLHKYARSVVEQNKGTRDWRFSPHFRIITPFWKAVVWSDTLLLLGQKDHKKFAWKAFEKQLHDDSFDQSDEWKALKQSYFTLCQFYNAAGFCDLILRAKDALSETPELNQHHFFIFDEYQDFNAAEENLLTQITTATKGKLIVGDDDQVLYETLKSGKASLIRAIYKDAKMVNAMLPFCGRCDYHITRTADHFIKQAPDAECIKKIYLPMAGADTSIKVHAVACAVPVTAVDYIRKFIEDHTGAIEQRKKELADGTSKDAFLLILSPSGAVKFYRSNDADKQLFELLKPYASKQEDYSDDYHRVLTYYSLGNYPENNFTFRKVLHFEQASAVEVLPLLEACATECKRLSAMDTPAAKGALAKAMAVKDIVESKSSIDAKVGSLCKCIRISSPALLKKDLERDAIDKARVEAIEHQDEEQAELEENQVKQMGAVELLTIVGSKGLSAEHVIVIGFDDVNMGWISRNAFYVAMSRARKSLHLLTALKAGGAAGAHKYLDQLPDAHVQFNKYAKGTRSLTQLNGRAAFLKYLGSLDPKYRWR